MQPAAGSGQDPRIAQVENGLLENAEIVFADSAVRRFTIYDRMQYYGVPSVSLAVIHNGKVEWSKAYGWADIAEKRAANTNTIYQAASLSKSVNAFCIMRLAQDGKLSLDKDIRGYLKTWTFPDNEFSKDKSITLRNLLSHTAGLVPRGFMGYTPGQPIPTLDEILNGREPANNEAVRPVMAPGSRGEYSGGGTVVTRKILEDNIASNYDSLLKKTVLIPLAMKNSSFSQTPGAGYKNIAIAYDANRKEIPGKYNIYPEQAPDGLWTTPTDYAKFIVSLQQSLASKPSGLLNPSTVREMVTPVLESSDAALGVFIKKKGGEKYFYHTGANVGYRSCYYGSLSTGVGVVVFVNSDNGQMMDEIVNSVASVYAWKDFYNPEVRKLAAVPDAVSSQYIGEYYSESPSLKIRVARRAGVLALTVHADDNTFEKMYFTGLKTFFLLSSPKSIAEFVIDGDGKTEALVVKEGGRTLFTAKKQIQKP